jgi:hypothetical protein
LKSKRNRNRIDVDVNVSFAFYAAAPLMRAAELAAGGYPGGPGRKRTVVLFFGL